MSRSTRARRSSRLGAWRRTAAARGPAWVGAQIVVTLGAALVIAALVLPFLRWVLYGADWGVVAANLRLYAVGLYPTAQLWRPGMALVVVALLLGASAALGAVGRELGRVGAVTLATLVSLPLLARFLTTGPVAALLYRPTVTALVGPLPTSTLWEACAAFAAGRALLIAALVAGAAGFFLARWAAGPPATRRHRRASRWVDRGWLVGIAAILLLLQGGWLRGIAVALHLSPGGSHLALVLPQDWGGLLLTLVLAVTAIAAAFPLGVLLALGRRSSLPLVKGLSVAYIETMRGVPLVTVLFMAQVMVPLVLPQGPWRDRVFRAVVGLALFLAAYVAEDVRGGLASIGKGQAEAARSVGLGTPATYRLVVLPQALRVVIPSLVGQFISLFKDTSLAQIVGLNELLGMALVIVAQPEWLGHYRESLLFAAVIYFVFSYAMARASRALEDARRLHA